MSAKWLSSIGGPYLPVHSSLMLETLGARLGRLRAARGWTQQELADRIAVSRVADLALRDGLAVPSERTVALLAGVFKLRAA